MTAKHIVGVVLAATLVAASGRDFRPTVVAAQSRAGATLTQIDVPGATSTFALGLNDEGEVVGRYVANGRTHGFLRSAEGDLTTIDVPGSSFTSPTAINAEGTIVGQYALPSAPSQRHGFLLADGVFTTIDPPGSTFTNVLGINERGEIVGRYCTRTVCGPPGSGVFQGFLLQNDEFTTISVPGAVETDGFGINASGLVAGGFVVDHSQEQLFTWDGSDFVTIAPPGGQLVTVDKGGLNDRGDIVGAYCDGVLPPCLIAPVGTHGFLISDGQFTVIDVPGGTATAAAGINARGDIVGGFSNNGATFHGFLLRQ